MNAILSWSMQCIVVTAVMIPFVVLLCRFSRNHPAVQHALWLVIMLKFVTPSIVEWPWQLSDLPVGALWRTTQATQSISSTDQRPPFPLSANSMRPERIVVEPRQIQDSAASNSLPAGASVLPALSRALILVWLAGALAISAHQYRLIKRQAMSIRSGAVAPLRLSNAVQEISHAFGLAPAPVVIVNGIASPFVWCLGRLTLAWPNQLLRDGNEDAVRSIIAHELAHIRRRDHWVAWLELIAATIWWWNPLFWLVRRNLRMSAEMACDAVALETFPDARCAYAEMLLGLATVPQTGTTGLVLRVNTSTPRLFERRMSMIVSESVNSRFSVRGVLVVAFLALTAIPTWSFRRANDVVQATEKPDIEVKQAQLAQLEIDLKPTNSRNFAVFPIKTALQRRKLGIMDDERPKPAVYVIINGLSVVNDAGMIDETALNMDALRKSLTPDADGQSGFVQFNTIYNLIPSRNHSRNQNATELVRWGLEGFGKDIGFKSARSSMTFVNDGSFDWDKEIALANEENAAQADESEDPIGDDRVRVYPVRTALSRLLTHTDCVVEFMSPPNEDGETLLSQSVRDAIQKYVDRANLRRKNSISFGGRLPKKFDEQLERPDDRNSFQPEIARFAKSMGFVKSSVAVGGI